jgi:hypothetical protein
VVVETTRDIGDADLGAEDESGALIRHGAGKVERSDQILSMIIGEAPYPHISYRCFTAKPTEGYLKIVRCR